MMEPVEHAVTGKRGENESGADGGELSDVR